MAEIIQLKNKSTGEDQHPKTTTDAVSHNNTSLSSVLNAKQAKLIEGDNITLTPKADGTVEISGVSPTSVVDNLNSTSPTSALSANQGRVLDSKFADKQNNLVSGTNIKTINGQSVLGEGDITIEAESVDIANNLTSDRTDAALAAAQGKALDTRITQLSSEVVVIGADGTKIPKSFIDLWDKACRGQGRWNSETKYFECLSVKNLNYNDAKNIYITRYPHFVVDEYQEKFSPNIGVRVMIPLAIKNTCITRALPVSYINSNTLEDFYQYQHYPIVIKSGVFGSKLKSLTIETANKLEIASPHTLTSSTIITTMRLRGLGSNLDISKQLLLGEDTILDIIQERWSDNVINISVHPDTYERLSQETIDLATSKNITIVTP